MKKILLILAIFASIGLVAQGTLRENNTELRTIAQYDLSNGDNSWIIDLRNPSFPYKWGWAADFNSLAGTLDGLVNVEQSFDNGKSWIAYPKMIVDTVDASEPMSFEGEWTTADKLKITLTVNNISGGTADINVRLFTIPYKNSR